jgi:hypothetical protein
MKWCNSQSGLHRMPLCKFLGSGWLCLVMLIGTLNAQDARGTITGRLSDASGAALPNAVVEITSVATGITQTSKTNESGNFNLPYLTPGTYRFTVESPGFKKYVRENIQIRINETVEVSPQLEVGDSKEVVTVTAEAPALATSEVSMGQVVDNRRIEDLPLFAGNAMDLVHLAPGTVNGTDLRLRKAPFNNAPSQFATDGSGNYNNEFTIDGMSNLYSDGTQPRVAFSPPQTSVAEFKVQTTAFDATLGHTLGSVVNVSTKSGTEDFHGELHEWLRNSLFDAPTIFQNRSGQTPAVYQDNRYGVSAGSAVVIPKLYNGRNKTFWFFAWEANKFGDPNNATTVTVPTAKMRTGDLSELLALGSSYQIFDPFTTQPNGSGNFSRQPFPGNIIPQNRLDPVALKILQAYPLPNQPGTSDYRNNFFLPVKALEDYWTSIGRIDHSFGDKHRIFIRAHRDYWQEDKNHFFGNNFSGIILNRINRGIAFDDVYVFSPSFILNFRYGLTAQEFPEQRVSRGFDLASLGFSPTLTGLIDPKLATFPNVQLGYITQMSAIESGDGSTSSLIHAWVGNFTKTISNHTLRFGPEFRIENEFRNRYNLDVSPQLIYNSTYTRGPLDTSAAPTAGGEFASLLLGVPAGQLGRTASYAERDNYFALYLQDDWKISRKLTLNVGIRMEHESPVHERYNRAVTGFAFGQSNPIEAAARTAYAASPLPELPASQFRVPGGLMFAGVNGQPSNYWNGQGVVWNPRFGLAYQITPKTVVRTGYGIFYGSIGLLYTNTVQTGFSATTPIQASLDNGVTYVANNVNPLPQGLQQPAGAGLGLATNLGQALNVFPSDRKQPYSQRWMFSLSREILNGFVVEAAYVGNRNTRLNIMRELNGIPLQSLSTSPSRDNDRNVFLNQIFPNPFFGLSPVFTRTITRAQLLRPYPEFTSVRQPEPIGYSWYHALQARIEKRFSDGFTFQLSYTYSKAMEATEFLNEADTRPYEVISALDRPHRIVTSGLWELPFGRGKRWGGNWNTPVNLVAGGWQLNGLMQRQSGAPLALGNRIFQGTNINDVLLDSDSRSVDHWLNRNAGLLTNSAQQPITNVNLRTFPLRFSGIRGPNQARWDLSLFKNFSLTERLRLQFRAECFNALNHPNLSDPNLDPTSASFGVISGQNPPRSWQFALKLSF